jgi:hypothetical protein
MFNIKHVNQKSFLCQRKLLTNNLLNMSSKSLSFVSVNLNHTPGNEVLLHFPSRIRLHNPTFLEYHIIEVFF